jgi:hypothetical protein
MNDGLAFPSDWPPDCPPEDAEHATGRCYRITKNDPPTEEDFQTPHEAGKLKRRPACLRCALSILRTRQDAVHQRQLFPFLGQYVAEGELNPSYGKTKLTPAKVPTHTTWWSYAGVNRRQLFTVLQEG